MKRTTLFAHLCFPALVTMGGFLIALQHEPLSVEMLLVRLLWSYLFYAAPHLAWAVISAAMKPKVLLWHAGFVASSCVLGLIGAMSFVVHDPSGLPYQWLLYWPLAGILLFAVVVVWLLAGRPHAGA